MRLVLRSAAVLLAAFLFATPAFSGVRITGDHPSTTKHEKFGFDLGARVALSTPTEKSDAYDHGIDAALTFTSMQTPHAGIGLELGYQHWPSSKAGAALDQYFSEFMNQLGGPSIQGTRAFVDAFQVSAHIRACALPGGAVGPWADLGVGLVRANATIDFPGSGTFAGSGGSVTLLDSHTVTYSPGISLGAGFDVSSQKGIRVGPDASYRWVFVEGDNSATFTAFAVGLHVRFAMP